MIARIHYANGQYHEALLYAQKAATVADTSQVDEVFVLGTYAALAGQVSECLLQLEEAIRGKPVLFGKAAVDPDLESCRSDVLTLLSRLAFEVRERLIRDVSNARELLWTVNAHAESSVVSLEATLVAKALDDISHAILSASYGDLLRLLIDAENVTKAIDLISSAEDAAANKSALERQFPALESYATAKERQLQELHFSPSFRLRFWPLWHFCSLILLLLVSSSLHNFIDEEAGACGLAITAFWFWIGMGAWPCLAYLLDIHADSVEAEQRLHHSAMLEEASAARSDASNMISSAQICGQHCTRMLDEARSLVVGLGAITEA